MRWSINVHRAPCSVLRRRLRQFGVFLGALCTVHGARLLACPLCKDSLPAGMARGFYWSILLMLAVPTLVVAAIAGVLWRARLKRRGLPGAPHE